MRRILATKGSNQEILSKMVIIRKNGLIMSTKISKKEMGTAKTKNLIYRTRTLISNHMEHSANRVTI